MAVTVASAQQPQRPVLESLAPSRIDHTARLSRNRSSFPRLLADMEEHLERTQLLAHDRKITEQNKEGMSSFTHTLMPVTTNRLVSRVCLRACLPQHSTACYAVYVGRPCARLPVYSAAERRRRAGGGARRGYF